MWRLAFVLAMGVGMARAGEAEVRFDRDIRPILSNHCFQCHGPDEGSREAGLRFDLRDGLFGETESGTTPVVPGDIEASELLRRIKSHDEAERMPPPDAGKDLTPEQIARVERWIQEGAVWQQHWAYITPERPPAPETQHGVSQPIDRFIIARLEQEKLEPSPRADAITLARRVALDLTGLPPELSEVDALASDPSQSAYEALVDRLLASPHFGERMAMYWLDLVRYADSCGYHSDVDQSISPYRDYVIGAFNQNMPFDRFTREQLAGDLLPEPTRDQRIATGFNRLNKTTEEGGAQDGEYLAKSAADRVRTASGVWLAATLGCAECHDHKYDPFTARDFYSFAAFFADVKERGVYNAANRDPVILLTTDEQQEELDRIDAEMDQLKALENTSEEQKSRLNELKKERAGLARTIPSSMVTVAVEPREMRILTRGNWLDESGDVVQAAIPAFLASGAVPDRRLTRLDLAEWLVDRKNPLTARVFVNRLWKLFFGVGLSKHLDDLGAQGEPPTHAELLDWLAVEFIESGWDVKHLVRLLVTSQTYQQSSIPSPELVERDPQNRLFARQSRWRLEAEFIRDGALATSGLLVREIGGPSVKPYQPEGYWDFLNFPKRKYKADTGESQYRRGLYTHWQRTFLHPSLLAFDAPTREECTAERPISNTPKAALALLNDPTYVEAARTLAARMIAEGGSSDEARIEWSCRHVLSRAPQAEEARLLSELLADARVAYQANAGSANQILQVGQAQPPEGISAEDLAAWTTVARALLNVSEAITRN